MSRKVPKCEFCGSVMEFVGIHQAGTQLEIGRWLMLVDCAVTALDGVIAPGAYVRFETPVELWSCSDRTTPHRMFRGAAAKCECGSEAVGSPAHSSWCPCAT